MDMRTLEFLQENYALLVDLRTRVIELDKKVSVIVKPMKIQQKKTEQDKKDEEEEDEDEYLS